MTPRPLLIAREARLTSEFAEVRSPFDRSVVANVSLASAEDANEAAHQAQCASASFAQTTTDERRSLLQTISRTVLERLELFADVICAEAGKPITQARAEVRRTAETFHLAAGEAERLGGELVPIDLSARTAGYRCLVRRVPRGPVLAIGPYNFPLNLIAHKLAPSLAVGAPVVVKPPPQAPSAALMLGELIAELAPKSWPDGFLSVLPCKNEVAEQLVTDDRFAVLSFTGSDRVGWHLKSIAGKKHVLLELGGDAATVVCEDANLSLAAQGIARGSAAYAGQVCIAVQRIFVQDSVRKAFEKELVDAMRALKYGDPRDANVISGPLIDDAVADRVEAVISQSGTLRAGGKRVGRMFAPALVTDPDPSGDFSTTEIFGPACALWSYGAFDEAIAKVNESRFGLQASVWTNHLGRTFAAHDALAVGGLIINDVPTLRVDSYPYGGTKDSGLGREGGRSGVEELTEPRVLVINPG